MQATGDGRPTISVNGRRCPLRASVLDEALREAGFDPTRSGIAVAVNGAVVRRASWADYRLRPGDEVEVVGAVQGG